MTFRYLFNDRWQWIFNSPNIFGTILVIFLCLFSVGVYLFYSKNEKKLATNWKYFFPFIAVSFGTIILALFALAKTYSRGGYTAFFVSFTVLFFCLKKMLYRKLTLAIVSVFTVMLLLIPAGINRLRDFTNPEDRSITNRLVIWEKAAVLSSDFPLSGVGPDKFGDLYRVAYSPLQMMEESRHPVNTYLYISVSYGFPILFLLLIVIFSVMKLSLNIRKEDNIGVGIFSAFIGWMVAVFFSTNLNIFLYISLILLLILTIILFIRNGNKLQHVNLLIPISAAALICMIIGLAGIYFRRDAPVRPRLERIL